jgi:hypothetical protein
VRDPLIMKIGKGRESNAARSLSRLFGSGLVETLVVDLPEGPVSCYIPPDKLFQHLATDFPIMFETRFGASPQALEEFRAQLRMLQIVVGRRQNGGLVSGLWRASGWRGARRNPDRHLIPRKFGSIREKAHGSQKGLLQKFRQEMSANLRGQIMHRRVDTSGGTCRVAEVLDAADIITWGLRVGRGRRRVAGHVAQVRAVEPRAKLRPLPEQVSWSLEPQTGHKA